MVWESHYWKQRLKQLSFEIETLANERDPSDLDVSNLEIAIFTSFFLIRKLLEAQTKLSAKAHSMNIKVKMTKKIPGAPAVDLMNRYDTFDLYMHSDIEEASVSIAKTCNIFIHSIFMWVDLDEGEDFIAGVRLTSSYEKDDRMYLVSIDEIQKCLKRIIADRNNVLEMMRDKLTGEMKVVR